MSFPYTYYSCGCYGTPQDDSEIDDEQTFDPRAPRSNYALYPLEQLLYCQDCREIRCHRCVAEEVICWYCPNCLFEVPSSQVRSEGNKCTRNCYNCPVCTSIMGLVSLAPQKTNPTMEDTLAGPFYLACSFCHWSTLDIGIEFEKHNSITQQLERIRNGGKVVRTLREKEKARDKRRRAESKLADSSDDSSSDEKSPPDPPDREELFSNMMAFYKTQLNTTIPTNPFSPLADLGFSSPSSLSRFMNIYMGAGNSKKLKRDKPKAMREAIDSSEGLELLHKNKEAETIERIREQGWEGTLSPTQKLNQSDPNIRLFESIRPVQTLLRTKRSKRCRTCRQGFLSRPETKLTSTRYKIKLLALNHIPRLSIRALHAPALPIPSSAAAAGITPYNYESLKPLVPVQFLLTLSNPLFDPVRITLATPATTPGRVSSKVTILCPQFDVGANTDVWDEALGSGPKRRPGSGIVQSELGLAQTGGAIQAEAGKIWDRGRNWTSVIVEVVPGNLPNSLQTGPVPGEYGDEDAQRRRDLLDEDDDVLEIPVFVRIEYETEAQEERLHKAEDSPTATTHGASKGKEKREEAFWCVLGVGRIVNQ